MNESEIDRLSQPTVKLLAVVVIYKMRLRESSSLRTLMDAAKQSSRDRLELGILIWDNTPGGQDPGEIPEAARYESAPDNPGLAQAYNRALQIASAEGYDWLLTLDQDSALPINFLVRVTEVAKKIETTIGIAAIVPQVAGDGHNLSPFQFALGAIPRWFPYGTSGLLAGATYALNSAATLRVAALLQIGGYDPLFPLDVSDINLFHRLHRAGKRVFLAGDLLVSHDFSLLDKHRRMSIERYQSQLFDECAFWDMNMSCLARVERMIRLAGRACKDILTPGDRAFGRLAISEIERRLLTPRRQRITKWKKYATARRTPPAEAAQAEPLSPRVPPQCATSDRTNRERSEIKPPSQISAALVKPRIVVSGVSLTEMGPLAVFNDALQSLASLYGENYEITALVHNKLLLNIPDVIYLEFPHVKSSWLKRLCFEYWTSNAICDRIRPQLWLSMDNVTPNVTAKIQAVYCHNPSPFYNFQLRDLWLDWKFGLFTLFYRYLYAINIGRDNHVIVQQDWIRRRFERSYRVKNVIVAHPVVDVSAIAPGPTQRAAKTNYRFFYPAFPRTFKNAEVALEAAHLLEQSGFYDFEIWLTFDATTNRYAAAIARRFAHVRSARWLGLLSRQEVFERYAEADCLLFPSKLETWGLPITEFKATGKPILVADLAYAHETVGTYQQAAFFNPNKPDELANIMRAAALGEDSFIAVNQQPISPPFAANWAELWSLLLPKESCTKQMLSASLRPTATKRTETDFA